MDTTSEQEQILDRLQAEGYEREDGYLAENEQLGRATALDVLRVGRSMIEQGYCKGSFAKDKGGTTVSPESPDAVTFCASGARRRAASLLDAAFETEHNALLALQRALPPGWALVPHYSDSLGTTREQVLALYDRAITALEKEVGL